MNSNYTYKELYLDFIDTLQSCGKYILEAKDEEVQCLIFEDFDIGVHTFLHEKNLNKLLMRGYINLDIKDYSLQLRKKVMTLQESDKWNLDKIREADIDWIKLFELCDLIKSLLKVNHTK